ncbi:hypothetical protein [Actinacidiphila rubida]|uniref:hypothetical protein n=1 Tax=Actinacidiphila rubida TaxID=310780 RepID=UPI000A9E42D0|nr:hypothetical protein [Actinacidiphila rubida]
MTAAPPPPPPSASPPPSEPPPQPARRPFGSVRLPHPVPAAPPAQAHARRTRPARRDAARVVLPLLSAADLRPPRGRDR